MPRPHIRPLLAALLLAPALSALAAGNAADGFGVFDQECGECHTVRPAKNRKGPTLFGIVGRQAGSVAGFANYSEAMKKSGIVWTPEVLSRYIENPKSVVPEGKMHYDGLAKVKAREDLIAYLAEQR